MTHIAFLRAVNVGGTGKLPMATLKEMCLEAGFSNPRTYIASGNLVFESEKSSEAVASELEARLLDYAGKPVGVIMRSPEEIRAIAEANPFAHAPGNRVLALLLPNAASQQDIDTAKNMKSEELALGNREIYIHYPEGQADSRLKLSAQDIGTARNMNTISKVYSLATQT